MACKVEALDPKNREAVEVIRLCDPVMWRKGGLIDAAAIYMAMDLAGVETERRRSVFNKVLTWIEVVREDIRDRG